MSYKCREAVRKLNRQQEQQEYLSQCDKLSSKRMWGDSNYHGGVPDDNYLNPGIVVWFLTDVSERMFIESSSDKMTSHVTYGVGRRASTNQQNNYRHVRLSSGYCYW